MDAFIDHLREWIPTGLVGGVSALILVVAHLALRAPRSAKSQGSFRRQMVMLTLSFGAVIAVLLVVPLRDESLRGNLLSLFGILVSAAIALASTTLIGNMMAGLMIRAIGSFRPGDFIEVERYFGRVTERGLVHTEIQTEDRDLMTVPNLFLATHPVKVVRADGTIVSGEVSLGYEVSHTRIEEILIAAARSAGLEEPFVRVLVLGDFSITYRVSGLLHDVRSIVSIRSALLAEMLDALHGADVEIVSPNFMNTRALDAERAVKPRAEHRRSRRNRTELETVAFDKADQASKDTLSEELEHAEKQLSDLLSREDSSEEGIAELRETERRVEDLRQKLLDSVDRSSPSPTDEDARTSG